MIDISIEMLDGGKILSNQMIMGKIIFLRGHKMVIDLIVFNMPDFDIILGMDFLTYYRAEIDCRKKNVRCQLEDGKKFFFREGHVLSLMINSVKVRKMLSMRCTGHLAHVVNKVDELVSFQNTPIVFEF